MPAKNTTKRKQGTPAKRAGTSNKISANAGVNAGGRTTIATLQKQFDALPQDKQNTWLMQQLRTIVNGQATGQKSQQSAGKAKMRATPSGAAGQLRAAAGS